MEKETNEKQSVHRKPDLSSRPSSLTAERLMDITPEKLYEAWTQKFDTWFAAPGSVLMEGKVDTPFFFATEFKGDRHPHYGRFLRLERNRLIEITWITGTPGTKGAETVVTVELARREKGTLLKLTHAGFPDEETKDGHQEAWSEVLEHLEKELKKEN